jgi:deoxyribonuclease V
LEDEQRRLAELASVPWAPPDRPLVLAGCFVAFAAGEAGPGHAGDHAWVGAALVAEGGRLLATAVVPAVAAAPYAPGLLAAREGAGLAAAVTALPERPDVLLVDATGRDHPRRAGLALHLGAVLDVPTVGVTHRPLRGLGDEPGPRQGATTPVLLDGVEVGRWVRTARGVRAVVAHAAWRTDPAVATMVVLRATRRARTPEPLRQARRVAREERTHDSQGV